MKVLYNDDAKVRVDLMNRILSNFLKVFKEIKKRIGPKMVKSALFDNTF
jgi:hypothetical protein